MPITESEEEQCLLDAVHYISSVYCGEVSNEVIKQYLETTSMNG